MTKSAISTIVAPKESAVGPDVAAKANIDAYFERIGFAGSIAPSLDTLTQLIQLHLAAIPFENLDSLTGAPVRLDLANLQQKLLFDRRGGYCLEHALLLRAMLSELDYDVKLHTARVLWARGSDEGERPASHLLLTVTVAGGTYIADTGFGGVGISIPVRLRADAEQAGRLNQFRVTGSDAGWQLETQVEATWRPLYAFAATEAGEADIDAVSATVAADPFFAENLAAVRVERDQRFGLYNTRLNTYRADQPVETRKLGSVAELREVLAGLFGIALPPAERLDPALARIVEHAAAAAGQA